MAAGPRGRGARAALLWVLGPLLVQVVVTRLGIPIFSIRNLIIVLPAMILLVALASSALDQRFGGGVPVVSALVIAGLLFNLVAHRAYYWKPPPFRLVHLQRAAR